MTKVNVISLERNSENGRVRCIAWVGQIVNDKFKGSILDVQEHQDSDTAVYCVLRTNDLENKQVGVLKKDRTVDFPDEISVGEAAQAYFNIH